MNTLTWLSPALSWAGASIALACCVWQWRGLKDATDDARLSGWFARGEMRRSMAERRAMADERETLRHLIAEVRTVLAFAPRPLALADFHPDDTIGCGPFPLPEDSPSPLGGDGASGHLTGEEDDAWGSL